jgi:hypothetical protein
MEADDKMSRNKWLIVAASAIVACVCIICVGALVAFVRPSLLNPLMPVYEYKIVPSTHEGYSLHTLTRGGTTYESDYTEYGLWTNFTDKQIGQTPLGGRVYTIPDQENYVVLYDFMSPIGVFRKSGTPPYDWRTDNFNEMHLYSTRIATATPNDPIISTDTQLIQDAVAPILGGAPAISPDQVNGSYESYVLYLYSEQLTGMSYGFGVYIDDSGQVYVAENTLSKEWSPASESFSEWAKSK